MGAKIALAFFWSSFTLLGLEMQACMQADYMAIIHDEVVFLSLSFGFILNSMDLTGATLGVGLFGMVR